MCGSIEVRQSERLIVVTPAAGDVVECSVPPLMGDILGAECRGEFILTENERGRLAFHNKRHDTPNRFHEADASPPQGWMHWHSMTKTYRSLCLLPELERRFRLNVTYYRLKSGGDSDLQSRGWIDLDGETVWDTARGPEPRPTTYSLGEALAHYLWLEPVTALMSPSVVVAALGLLDRRLAPDAFSQVQGNLHDDMLWAACISARQSVSAA